MSIQPATFNEFVLEKLSGFSPERTAFCFDRTAFTFGTMAAMIDRFTLHLSKMGITQGCGVGYAMPNAPQLLCLFIAIARLGAYAVPVFHMIPDKGKAAIFSQCRVKVVITNPSMCAPLKLAMQAIGLKCGFATFESCDSADYRASLNDEIFGSKEGMPAISVESHIPLLMAATSGTTGAPKFVAMTQKNVCAVMHASASMASVKNESGYSSMAAFPLCTSGVLVTLGMLLSGVTIIFSSDMSPVTYLQLTDYWKADSLSAPPAYFEGLLMLPSIVSFDRSSVRRIMTGMDFFSASLLKRLCDAFPHVASAANGYGLVETSTIFMHWQADSPSGLFADTRPMVLAPECGNEIDVCDSEGRSVRDNEEGELFVKGNSVVSSYLGGHPDNAIAFIDGWFKTGDSAKKINKTTVALLGRKKHLIKRGGKSISPFVVQTHINAHQQVLHCAVVGVPHQLYGQMVWGFVVPRKGQTIALKDMMKHCRESLPPYMVPDQIRFIDEIPTHQGVGKINIDALVNMAIKELITIEGADHGASS
jgi:acyl-coenzyme A synthetase/AMP-(fatty) acid ligase